MPSKKWLRLSEHDGPLELMTRQLITFITTKLANNGYHDSCDAIQNLLLLCLNKLTWPESKNLHMRHCKSGSTMSNQSLMNTVSNPRTPTIWTKLASQSVLLKLHEL